MSSYSVIEEIRPISLNIFGRPKRWRFTMFSTMIDDDAPHRPLLERFAAIYPDAAVNLPPYDRDEDFVQATAMWRGASIKLFYETLIVSHLAICSREYDAVLSFRAALLPLAA